MGELIPPLCDMFSRERAALASESLPVVSGDFDACATSVAARGSSRSPLDQASALKRRRPTAGRGDAAPRESIVEDSLRSRRLLGLTLL